MQVVMLAIALALGKGADSLHWLLGGGGGNNYPCPQKKKRLEAGGHFRFQPLEICIALTLNWGKGEGISFSAFSEARVIIKRVRARAMHFSEDKSNYYEEQGSL